MSLKPATPATPSDPKALPATHQPRSASTALIKSASSADAAQCILLLAISPSDLILTLSECSAPSSQMHPRRSAPFWTAAFNSPPGLLTGKSAPAAPSRPQQPPVASSGQRAASQQQTNQLGRAASHPGSLADSPPIIAVLQLPERLETSHVHPSGIKAQVAPRLPSSISPSSCCGREAALWAAVCGLRSIEHQPTALNLRQAVFSPAASLWLLDYCVSQQPAP